MRLWDAFLSVLRGIPGKSISISFRTSWTGYVKPEGPKLGNYKWFSDAEVIGLDKEFTAKLDMAREKAGVPFVITCGLRTPEQNACLHGAVADSAHLAGLAVDLATGDDHTKNRIIYGLCVAGLGDRIGEYFAIDPTDPNNLITRHLHVDVDVSKVQEVTWSRRELN